MDDGAIIEPTSVAPRAFCLFPFAPPSGVQQYTILTQKPYVMIAKEVSIIYTGRMII